MGIKTVLKEMGIRFQSPRDTLRVHWTEGVKVYNSAKDAVRAMRERGWPVPDLGEERRTGSGPKPGDEHKGIKDVKHHGDR